VKKQLKSLYRSRDQYMMYIGQLAFEEYRSKQLPNEALQEPCSTLEEVYEQVGLWEEQLNVLQGMKNARVGQICPYCRAPVLTGAAFCNSCGKTIAPAAPAAGPQKEGDKAVIRCQACGSLALEDASFCPACGWRLGDDKDDDDKDKDEAKAKAKDSKGKAKKDDK
jgi:DNA-directed RNA polymerase subunit RPC12/RpoP